MIKKRFISLLVLLMTAVTGAWAQEQSETIVTTNSNIVEGTHFTISNNSYVDGSGMCADVGGITVTPKNGETITQVVISCTYGPGGVNDDNTSVSSGTKVITNSGETITVTGVNASTFTFTCSYADPQFGQFVVYYTEAPATVAVTGVTLLPTTATLTVGETTTLTPTVAPATATDKSVTWLSSNTSVATVSNSGVVTAVGAGTATITVTTTDGAFTATCTVTVAEPTYTVSLKEGTADAAKWQGKAGSGEYQALPLEGLEAGTAVTVKYDGRKRVKSVKAVKKATLLSLTVSDPNNWIDGNSKTIYYLAGETWRQAIENHAKENAGWIIIESETEFYPTFTGYKGMASVLDNGHNYPIDSTVIDGTHSYIFAE